MFENYNDVFYRTSQIPGCQIKLLITRKMYIWYANMKFYE